MRNPFPSAAIAGWFVVAMSCSSGQPGTVPAPTSLRNDVMPIFARYGCAMSDACHNNPDNRTAHETDFRTAESTYTSLIGHPSFSHCPDDGSNAGISPPYPGKPRVAPGDSSNSFLIDKVRETRDNCGAFYGRMPPPPIPRLTDSAVEVLVNWILQGARDN